MNAMEYPDSFFERHRAPGDGPKSGSGRTPFGRDRDRVLYSSAFRALHGKTQVIAAHELGYAHNRETHSLKVAQLGRSVAQRLSADGKGPHPDMVEAACLAHDIGHPPFGHVGESALQKVLDKMRLDALRLPKGKKPSEPLDGFEGNAQNLRILTYLSTHRDFETRGLHLTRGTLAATLKYPNVRETAGKGVRKWGAYEAERETLDWILQDRPAGLVRTVEADLMDWCDDVTYAVHDVEDFYRLGFIPLDRLFRFELPASHPNAGEDASSELRAFMDFVDDNVDRTDLENYTRLELVMLLHELADRIHITEPFRSTRYHKGTMQWTSSDLITFFADAVTVAGSGRGHDGTLEVPRERRALCELLKQLIWFYVIRKHQFAGQQVGQGRIVTNLATWIADDPERLLPPDRLEELHEHQDNLRAVADYIVTLTESMAIALHRKLSGQDLGAVTDVI